MRMTTKAAVAATATVIAAAVAATASAQTKAPQQVVKPPVAQAWIDVATFSGFGMPAMGSAGANPMAMAGSLFGGAGEQKNVFARTGEGGSAGAWVDVALFTSRNPGLMEAQQAVPPGMQLQSLKLITQKPDPKGRIVTDDGVVEHQYERPKGKLYLYWGCGETVRAGQPLVLDMATATPESMAKFFTARRATQRGAHNMPERPHWPNEQDARMVPANASLVGEHAFSGQGVPESFRFTLGAQQDIMPPIELRQTSAAGGATQLEWTALPTARGYFVAAMGMPGGARGGGEVEMAFWTSSEVADTGTGLVEFQTNPSVDRWLKEKVLLEPSVTRCAVPGGIFGESGGAFLRMIAYGSELNLAHPPRPADPKIAWEPEWAVKVRVKSVANAMLGMDMSAMQRGAAAAPSPSADAPASAEAKKEPVSPLDEIKKEGVNVLRGIFGR